MEKRAILAAVLMAALLMVYQFLFMPSEPPKPPDGQAPQAQKSEGERTSAPPPAAQAPAGTPAPPATPAVPPAVPTVRPPERTIGVETPLYKAAISSVGGAIVRWELQYRGDKPMVLPGVLGSEGLVVLRQGQAPASIAFAADRDAVKLDAAHPQGDVRLSGSDGLGLEVTQVLRFRADSYVVERDIRVSNAHSVPQGADVALLWKAPVEWPKDQEAFAGTRPIHAVRLPKGASWAHREYLTKEERYTGDARWVAFESSIGGATQAGVYLTALIPRTADFKVMEGRREVMTGAEGKPVPIFEIGVRGAVPVLAPGQSWEGRVTSYLGPMEYDRLKGLDVGLEKAIYFGGFPFPESWADRVPTLPMEWIAVPVLAVMRWFYSFIPNYGIAIILLTVITKVVFFPLTLKSMTSMKAMQALQPQINALRSKYKSDPQRLQRETMELYRANKVNPLGGCLPMIVQIPIFYALYVALSVSVEMQNAPFICFGEVPGWVPLLGGHDVWICDLAAYDPTYVLPILMGVSMFVQQKMQPVMGDPRQAKMMLFMPVVFTFMFLNLPSGLVLYWTLSNVLQIAQQKYMERGGAKPSQSGSAKAQVPARALKKA
jgi:YidC/Oxa1 family membrane protein insertase